MNKTLRDRISDGVARRLAGDEAGFIRVDDEIQADPLLRDEPAARKFHALRVAACGAALVLAAGCTGDREPPPNCVYAGPPEDAVSRQVPPPPLPPPSAPRPSPDPRAPQPPPPAERR